MFDMVLNTPVYIFIFVYISYALICLLLFSGSFTPSSFLPGKMAFYSIRSESAFSHVGSQPQKSVHRSLFFTVVLLKYLHRQVEQLPM